MLATLLIRYWARVTAPGMTGFDSVCESPSGKQPGPVYAVGAKVQRESTRLEKSKEAGPWVRLSILWLSYSSWAGYQIGLPFERVRQDDGSFLGGLILSIDTHRPMG